jgi:dolichol-phosphate mannosyltransferase
VFRLLTAAQAVALGVILERLRHGRARRAPLAAGADSPAGAPRITVLIPARDEAARLPSCLAPLRDAPGVFELLVVDDRSTDGTAEIAASLGARVVAGRELPDGWVGKPWALQQGLEAARGEIVVCLDADVRPDPALPAALAGELQANGVDLLSGGVRFACDGPGERLLHPALLATLIYRFGALDAEGRQPAAHRALCNGQCLAFRADVLREAGGFALAAGNMTDDVALARAVRNAGGTLGFVDASALIEVRMYESAMETWNEWARRSLALPDVTSPAWRAADAATIWLVQGLPMLRLLTGRVTRLDRVALALRAGILAASVSAYSRRGVPFWLSPLLDPLAALALTLGAVAPRRTWRGRTYPRGAGGTAPR